MSIWKKEGILIEKTLRLGRRLRDNGKAAASAAPFEKGIGYGTGMITEKVLGYMEEHGMLPASGNIVVGVSGGADSVCLLYLLTKLRRERPLRLLAVHVNHGLRPEAGKDAAFVQDLCYCWEVPFCLVQEDVGAFAKDRGVSCEEAGRLVRYRAFGEALERLKEETGEGGCIAVAHNSDDRAETLLFHMLRGSGLTGMGSIRPVRENRDGSRIIRPLLSCTRAEIEAYLQGEGIGFCTDATNGQDVYTRNKIRNRVFPYVEREISGRAREHLSREADLLAKTADFIEEQTKSAIYRCCVQGQGRLEFDTAAFGQENPYLQDQMILFAFHMLGSGRNLSSAHVAEVGKLFLPACVSGRRVRLPFLQVDVRREFGRVVFSVLKAEDSVAAGENTGTFLEIGSFFVPGLGQIRTKLLAGPKKEGDFSAFLKNIPENKYTKWLDYDKIVGSAIFRTRCTGDYLTINAAMDKKSLKRYMVEEKIPAVERDGKIVLADGAHVMWVPGHRISAAYKISAQTASILEVQVV